MTSIANPLSANERHLACDQLLRMVALLEQEPADPALPMPVAEQIRRINQELTRARQTAAELEHDQVGFEEVAHARHLLGFISSQQDNPQLLRSLNEVLAKLEHACDGAMERRQEEYLAQMAERAARDGFAIQHVLGQGDPAPCPPFSYTVGLSAVDAPELCMIGLEHQLAEHLLRQLAQRVCAGERLLAGERLHDVLEEDMPLMLVEAPASVCQALVLARSTGRAPLALQVLWPDPQGRLPGEDGCDSRYALGQQLPDWAGT